MTDNEINEVESLRSALMDPPADVQEAVIKKLGLVSGEALDISNAMVESLRGELERKAQESFSLSGTVETWKEACEANQEALAKAHTALQKAKECLLVVRNKVLFKEGADAVEVALASIKECL